MHEAAREAHGVCPCRRGVACGGFDLGKREITSSRPAEPGACARGGGCSSRRGDRGGGPSLPPQDPPPRGRQRAEGQGGGPGGLTWGPPPQRCPVSALWSGGIGKQGTGAAWPGGLAPCCDVTRGPGPGEGTGGSSILRPAALTSRAPWAAQGGTASQAGRREKELPPPTCSGDPAARTLTPISVVGASSAPQGAPMCCGLSRQPPLPVRSPGAPPSGPVPGGSPGTGRAVRQERCQPRATLRPRPGLRDWPMPLSPPRHTGPRVTPACPALSPPNAPEDGRLHAVPSEGPSVPREPVVTLQLLQHKTRQRPRGNGGPRARVTGLCDRSRVTHTLWSCPQAAGYPGVLGRRSEKRTAAGVGVALMPRRWPPRQAVPPGSHGASGASTASGREGGTRASSEAS